MLNLEYARIVEQDRRRTIAERIRIERALHPEETGLTGENVMFLKADICRAELDLEMEAVVSRRTS